MHEDEPRVSSGAPGEDSEPSEPDAPRKLAPGLYLVATPIGNLGDVTLRALEVLAGVDAVLCEDTRVTSRLLARHGIRARLVLYHEHNAERARPGLIARLKSGARLALVSDAGTPLVSDPGYKLAREAAKSGVALVPIPGASAALAALVASGLPTDRFLFVGFLPAKGPARRRALAEVAGVAATLIVYESTPRLAATLADMKTVLGDRPAAVARELTKLYEEIVRDTLSGLAQRYAEARPKGEIVIVIGPPEAQIADDAALDRALDDALARLKPSAAAAEVAAATGRSRREVYARAMARARDP